MSYKLVFHLEGPKVGDEPRQMVGERKQLLIDIREDDLAKAGADRAQWANECLLNVGNQVGKWLVGELAEKYGGAS